MNDRFKFRIYNVEQQRYVATEFDKQFMLGTFIIEQSTTLKDKNGNLIYEGDIIKDKFGRKFKVVWNQEDVMFEGRIIIYDPEYSDRYDFYEGATDDVEIIGNIHEQKEE